MASTRKCPTPRAIRSVSARQRRGHGERVGSRPAQRRQEVHDCLFLLGLWRQLESALRRERSDLYRSVNVEGTVNVLEAARLNGVKKFTIASSSSVYGVNSKVPFAESDPIFQAISPYAASKLACEALGHVYHHVYGLDVVMLRFFTVYGHRRGDI